MILIYSGGMSAVKYGGASSGKGGRSFATTVSASRGFVWFLARSMSSKAEVSNDRVSGFPHWRRKFKR